MALVLASRTETLGSVPVNLVQVSLPPPHGCTHGGACLHPLNHVAFNTSDAPSFVDGAWHYVYPAGEYRLYLLTEPGATATARLSVLGPGGEVAFEAEDPVSARFELARSSDPAAAVLSGSFRHAMSASGFVTMGLSHIAAPTAGQAETGTFGYQECLTRGGPAPLNPEDCLAASIVTASTGEVHAAGQPLLLRPHYFAGSIGGFTLTASGMGTWESPLLEPGEWVNSYRVQRGGSDPAIETWALWLEL